MKFEYKLYDVLSGRSKRQHEEKLNALGLDGWEIIDVAIEKRADNIIHVIYLKRPVERWRRHKDGRIAQGGRSYLFGPRTV